MFGDGKICASKPISESDLASYMANCLWEEDKFDEVVIDICIFKKRETN